MRKGAITVPGPTECKLIKTDSGIQLMQYRDGELICRNIWSHKEWSKLLLYPLKKQEAEAQLFLG